jgi:uncharacterized protein YqhQ
MAKGDSKTVKVISDSGPLGYVFFMAFIGALVYFVEKAEGLWEIILAFLKAMVWPVFVAYEVLRNLNIQ